MTYCNFYNSKNICSAIIFFTTISCCGNLLALTSTNFRQQHHRLGVAYGTGDPANMHGFRANYSYKIGSHAAFTLFADFSYARWHSNSANMRTNNIIAIAPVLRATILYPKNKKLYFELSIGPARKSTRYVNNQLSGSKWTFQDYVGIGANLSKHWMLNVYYLHYSNASLAKPNPSIDILPMIKLSYKF